MGSISEEELVTEENEKLKDRLSQINYDVNKALRDIHLREVSSLTQVNERMIRRARFARNREYEAILNCYFLYEDILMQKKREKLREIVKKRILEPCRRDTLYELFVLFKVMDVLGKLAHLKEIHLMKSGVDSIGVYEKGEKTIFIYFQKATDVLTKSQYKQIFEGYDLDVSTRIPDIIIKVKMTGEKTRIIIIEVKRTDNREYIVDSVYKVLGYLADFKEHFEETPKPHALLVVWSIEKESEEKDIEKVVTILRANTKPKINKPQLDIVPYLEQILSKLINT